ncbi:MAG: hypothetical protein IKB51_03555 [Clostridia bacterium]|nr:hypothetical protein [Clostridia bacterium]
MEKSEAQRLNREIREMGESAIRRVGLFGLSPAETEKVGINFIQELYEKGYDDEKVKALVLERAEKINT